MTALLSQGSYRAVPTRPFHGEILCNSNALEGIRTSDHSEMGRDEPPTKLTRPWYAYIYIVFIYRYLLTENDIMYMNIIIMLT